MDIPSEDQIVSDGLAAIAITEFEIGKPRDEIESDLLAAWIQLGSQPGAFRAASKAIASFPQPILESAEKSERMRPIREMLGVTSTEDQLLANLAARELLEELADKHG